MTMAQASKHLPIASWLKSGFLLLVLSGAMFVIYKVFVDQQVLWKRVKRRNKENMQTVD